MLTAPDLTDPAVQQLVSELFDEAEDFVEVIRRLWDSWEDDAEIRDAATGRFIDRDKIHYIDFVGSHFSVKGPGIVPRPPQGQPLVTALAHATVPYRFAARSADIVFVTPIDTADARRIVDEIRSEQAGAGRADETLHVFADLVVFLDTTTESGAPAQSPTRRSGRQCLHQRCPNLHRIGRPNSPICSRIGRPPASPAIACDPAPSRTI